MNPGGEPERDETGLPPVDIEIPDDARELDRDVQAFYRERRAQRRHQRGHRLRGSLAKDGIVLPLLACCLILALITGTLLTVFTATSDLPIQPGTGNPTAPSSAGGTAGSGHAASSGAASSAARPSPAASGSAHPGTRASPDISPAVLSPHATLAVDGLAPIQVRSTRRAALVLIPAHCNCTATVSWLIDVAFGAKARTYLVYTTSTRPEVYQLYRELTSARRGEATLAIEPDSVLRHSIPASLPAGGLTAILLGKKGLATYATKLSPAEDPTTLIRALTH